MSNMIKSKAAEEEKNSCHAGWDKMTGEIKADTKGEALQKSLGGEIQRYDGRGDCWLRWGLSQ